MKFLKTAIFSLCLLLPSLAFAAGTVTVTKSSYVNSTNMYVLEFTCVGDSSTGSVPDTTTNSSQTNYIEGMYLYKYIIENDSGDTSVTDNSDVYVYDDGGTDLLGGNGVDQLDDNTRNSAVLDTWQPVFSAITLHVENQATASGKYTVTLVFIK